jgi:alkanesulfonate monooxygenase SsuD/methylene tetrahydromethanopterin reductase-like flavin-dependent oxidoreductase (luciferase family)
LALTLRLAKVADEVGLDLFAAGEHHRLDMAISSPAMVLSAIAARTERIRLTSATTLIGTLDPVRVYEDFATLDLLSGGRAEIIVGRASFIESFALFGRDLADSDELFVEGLDLLRQLNRQEVVSWEGRFRAPLDAAEIAPRATREIPIWVGVGGTPMSAERTGRMGLPMNIAILGGPERFIPFAQLHARAGQRAGHGDLRRAISGLGLLADDSAEARAIHQPLYTAQWRRGLKNRMPGFEVSQAQYDYEAGPRGGLYVGSPKEVAAKIRLQREWFGHDRCLVSVDLAGATEKQLRRSVELLAEVKQLLRS